ncbi:MAG: Omp28 family outer membrane lipoprotein [Bacteroidia bacterium]|nr:Omp28 family outer membrane lipoprotein [Bacteroidia bacterium]
MKEFLYKIIYIFILTLVICLSCDKVEPPYKTVIHQNGNTDTVVKIKKLLLEDFTGHTCKNCPDAHQVMRDLENIYKEQLIAIGIHVGEYAEPVPNFFPPDYRTSAGDELDGYFNISNSGLPKGMVNRKEYDGSLILGYDAWGSAIENILQDTVPEIFLTITNSYNSSTRQLSASIKTEFLENFSTLLKLAVYLTEDSIVSPQQDGSQIVQDYIHRHVLRTALNSTWGDNITSVQVNINDTIVKNYTITLDNEWVDSRCAVISFVYDDNTKEIIQAEIMELY